LTTAPEGFGPLVLDRRYLLLVLVPVIAYVLVAYVVLDATRRDDVVFRIIPADAFASVAAAEARYRSFWVTAFLLSAATSLAVATSAALGLGRLRLARDRGLILALIAGIALASIAVETLGPLRGDNRWYDDLGRVVLADGETRSLFRALFLSPPTGLAATSTLHLLDTGLDVVKVLGAIALTLVGFGLVLTLAEPLRPEPAERRAARLALDLSRQKELLQHGATVYVLAIVAMLAWMHWPLPYLADAAVRAEYRDLLVANGLLQGTAYSLGIAAIYLPAAMLLRRRIADLAESAPGSAADWLHENGLETRPFDQLRELATVLLPAIIGILPVLEKLGQ
jgi:hypothetical protein